MIITQTPYRVSFAGGGTDLPAFYRDEPGAVLSVTIQKHMYVTVGPRFEPTIRVSYTRTEIAENVAEVQHSLVREALRRADLKNHLEVTTIGDVPAGTGLGSSSTLTVGLLHAFHAYQGKVSNPEELARQACQIEIETLGKPIGRQDQYAAAYGGLNYFRFLPDDTVVREPVPCKAETLAELERRTLLIYTNLQRDADSLLKLQSEATRDKGHVLRAMRDLATEMRSVIAGKGDLDELARLLHEGWELKRSIASGISPQPIEACYETARRAGAQGGKLCGAGGGGFVLLLAPPERHQAIREALGCPRELEFEVDRLGSRIIFVGQRHR
jgi:D-glycero-alpha-D-manno-heptose-7-phosphate kinase